MNNIINEILPSFKKTLPSILLGINGESYSLKWHKNYEQAWTAIGGSSNFASLTPPLFLMKNPH